MNDFLTNYGLVALGVFISIILPVLKQYIIKPEDGEVAGAGGAMQQFMAIARPYLVTGIFSLVVALLLMAFLGDNIADWRAALLAGYAGDSTLQKLRN